MALFGVQLAAACALAEERARALKGREPSTLDMTQTFLCARRTCVRVIVRPLRLVIFHACLSRSELSGGNRSAMMSAPLRAKSLTFEKSTCMMRRAPRAVHCAFRC